MIDNQIDYLFFQRKHRLKQRITSYAHGINKWPHFCKALPDWCKHNIWNARIHKWDFSLFCLLDVHAEALVFVHQWQVSTFMLHKTCVGSGRCGRCPGPTGPLLQWPLQAFIGTVPMGGLGLLWSHDGTRTTHRSLYRPDAFLPHCWLLLFLDQITHINIP